MTTVWMNDIRRARMCSRGARDFFVRHDLDWNAFLKEGIDAEALWNTGDPMAQEVVRVAREREEEEHGRKQ